MKTYSISDIEALTGIRAHTIRIWEQRYSFFTPKRTETNIRYYDEEDLRLFLNIATLNENGYKISRISKMSSLEIIRVVNSLKGNHLDSEVQLKVLANAVVRLDEQEFENALNSCINKMGLSKAMETLIFPLFQKLGFMWKVGLINVVHEQFAMHLVCNKITIATYHLKNAPSGNGKRFILFLPQGELYEAALLYAKYMLLSNGHQVLYLGANLPAESVAKAISYYQPDHSLMVITNVRTEKNKNNTVNKMLEKMPDTPLMVVGAQVSEKMMEMHPRLLNFMDLNALAEMGYLNTVSVSS